MKEMEKRAAAEVAAVSHGDNARATMSTSSSAAPTTEGKLGSQSQRSAIRFGFGAIKKRPNLGRGSGFGA